MHGGQLIGNQSRRAVFPDLDAVMICRMEALIEVLRTSEAERNTVINHSEYGIQLGRRFRALKLWMIIRYFGHEGLAARIREHVRLAKLFASWVEESPNWELMAPQLFALVCFRANPDSRKSGEVGKQLDILNETIMNAVNATGKAFLSHTKLNDKLALRLSIGNIRTTEEHVRRVWELLNAQLHRLKAEAHPNK